MRVRRLGPEPEMKMVAFAVSFWWRGFYRVCLYKVHHPRPAIAYAGRCFVQQGKDRESVLKLKVELDVRSFCFFFDDGPGHSRVVRRKPFVDP